MSLRPDDEDTCASCGHSYLQHSIDQQSGDRFCYGDNDGACDCTHFVPITKVDQPLKPIIRLTLDEDECGYIVAALSLTAVQLQHAPAERQLEMFFLARNWTFIHLGIDRANALNDRIKRLATAAFPHIEVKKEHPDA